MEESARQQHPKPATVLDLLDQGPGPVLKLGCPVLDATCAGGLRPGLCEICGEAGTGKSQLCLQLLLQVQLPEDAGGLNGRALYISTEKVASSRLVEMASGLSQRYPGLRKHRFLENILIRTVDSLEDQNRTVFEWVPALLNNSEDNIRLIIVDSVAAFCRLEGRNQDHSLLSYHLHQLAMQHNICIIAVNQVSDVISGQHAEGQLQFLSSGRFVKPALGLGWTFGLSRRLILTRDCKSPPRRIIFATGASYCPDQYAEFCIHQFGVFGLPRCEPEGDTFHS